MARALVQSHTEAGFQALVCARVGDNEQPLVGDALSLFS